MTRWFAVTMGRVLAITSFAGILLDLAAFVFAVKPGVVLQLGFMVPIAITLGLIIASPILIISWWRAHRWRSLLPLLAAMLSLVLSIPAASAGGAVREWLFRSRLPKYEEVVGLIAAGTINVDQDLRLVELPAKYSELAAATLAEQDSSGTITIEFIIGGGFPVKHTGYLYRSHGTLEDWRHSGRWPKAKQLSDHWYAISD